MYQVTTVLRTTEGTDVVLSRTTPTEDRASVIAAVATMLGRDDFPNLVSVTVVQVDVRTPTLAEILGAQS